MLQFLTDIMHYIPVKNVRYTPCVGVIREERKELDGRAKDLVLDSQIVILSKIHEVCIQLDTQVRSQL
jgi:hypothetical protein